MSSNVNVNNLKISIVLSSLRGAMGVTQGQLAELLGVPKATINRAESLRLPLKADVLLNLVSLLDSIGIVVDLLSSEPTFKLTERFIENRYQALLNANG